MCVKPRKKYATGIRLETEHSDADRKESHLNRNLCVHIRHVKPLFRTGILFSGLVKIL